MEMIEIIWRFQVKPGRESEFEQANGPRGAWYEFYRRADGYLGTTLLRDLDIKGLYFTIDRWRNQGEQEAFVAEHRDEFDIIDERCDAFTDKETRVGLCETIEP